jgi:hypothetical protein
MWRVIGLALVFVIGAAAPAEAGDMGRAGKRIAVAAHQGAARAGTRRAVQERTVPVQLTAALARTQSSLRLFWGACDAKRSTRRPHSPPCGRNLGNDPHRPSCHGSATATRLWHCR